MRWWMVFGGALAGALAGCGDDVPVGSDAGRTDLGGDVAMDLGARDVATSVDLDASVPGDVLDPCNPRLRRADGGTAFTVRPGCPLPNLVPVIERVQIQSRTFADGSCEVMEGCTVPGHRRLLRFDLVTPNIGDGDLYVGPPVTDNRPDGRFEYGTCHMHWHFRGYADYTLESPADGGVVGRGHKQSFCLLDSGRYMGMGASNPQSGLFTCADQGIHAGWYDLYDRALDCQYVDITDLPPGHYRLRVRINELRGLEESNYADDETTQDVDIPATDPVSMDPTDACPSDLTGAARDCGWEVNRGLTCTPGSTVTVGCNASCGAGSCVGNPMIRICSGDGPCTHALAVAENDDACGNSCPSVTFPCPLIRNRYTVMTGGFRAGAAYECRIAAQ